MKGEGIIVVTIVGKFNKEKVEVLLTIKPEDSLSKIKHALIFAYLKNYQNNISKVASKLKISRPTIYNVLGLYDEEMEYEHT